MKPLVVSLLPRPPHSARDGLAIRNYHLLAALASWVKALTLADRRTTVREGEWPAGVDSERIGQAPRGLRRVAASVGSLVAGGAYSERMYRSARAARRLREIVVAEDPPLDRRALLPCDRAALREPVPLWIDFHNLDSEIWERSRPWRLRPGSAGLPGSRRAGSSLSRAVLARAATGVSCVSPRDATHSEGSAPRPAARGSQRRRPREAFGSVRMRRRDEASSSSATSRGRRTRTRDVVSSEVWPHVRRPPALGPRRDRRPLGRRPSSGSDWSAGHSIRRRGRAMRGRTGFGRGGGRPAARRRRDAPEDPRGGRGGRAGRVDVRGRGRARVRRRDRDPPAEDAE